MCRDGKGWTSRISPGVPSSTWVSCAGGDADADARGVVVALIDAGMARLRETAPVHARGIADLFVSRLDDQELAVLKSALDKVTLDCNFG